MTTIGGVLDYARLAQIHRPSDPVALAEEVRRLSASGLSPTDIAAALRIDLVQVREWLGGGVCLTSQG